MPDLTVCLLVRLPKCMAGISVWQVWQGQRGLFDARRSEKSEKSKIEVFQIETQSGKRFEGCLEREGI